MFGGLHLQLVPISKLGQTKPPLTRRYKRAQTFGSSALDPNIRSDPKLIDSRWPKQAPADLNSHLDRASVTWASPDTRRNTIHQNCRAVWAHACKNTAALLFLFFFFFLLLFKLFLGKGLVSRRHKLPSFPSLIEYQTPPLRFLHGDIGFSWQAGLQTTQRNVYSSAAPEEPGGWASQPREILLSSQEHFHGDWGAYWIRNG